MYNVFDIVKIPEMNVASIQIQSSTPEKDSLEKIKDFILKNKLLNSYYHFGFTISDNDINRGIFGYERWICIPNDFAVQEPFQKKFFTGGTYATKIIRIGEYDKWANLLNEVSNSHYEIDITSSIYEGRMLEQYNLPSITMTQQNNDDYIKILIRIKEND